MMPKQECSYTELWLQSLTEAPERNSIEPLAPADGQTDQPRRKPVWYVLHTYSGYENKVKKALEKAVHDAAMEKEIFRVIVPTEEEVEIKDGHKRTVERRVFPGYVLVEMLEFIENDPQSDEAWYLIRHTNGVTGFVGEGMRPTPLTQTDVDKIMGDLAKISGIYRAGLQCSYPPAGKDFPDCAGGANRDRGRPRDRCGIGKALAGRDGQGSVPGKRLHGLF